MASCAPWNVAGGSPPKPSEMFSAVMERASATLQPVRRTVKSDEQAIAVVHPRHKKRASAIPPFSTRTASSRMSPQTGFVVCTCTVASASLPALRGFRKCSRTKSLYIPAIVAQLTPHFATLAETHLPDCNIRQPWREPGSAGSCCAAVQATSATRLQLESAPDIPHKICLVR